MTRSRRLRFALGVVFGSALAFVAPANAQQATPSPSDAVFARARQLVVNGSGSAGRLLIDSVLSATPETSPVHGEALYWRAALAASSADAERDYRKLVVEYPLSAHVGDALLQLAQLESGRGDRAAASRHLDQFLSDNPKSPERPRAVLLYVRLLMEQNDLPRGCSVLRTTLSELPESAVETRNQLEYYLPRCTANDVGPGGAIPVSSPASSPARDTASAAAKSPASGARTANTANTATWKGRFTLQVAAYKTKADADALMKKLKARKIDARVTTSGKLFRVQVGHYATRDAATAAQKDLKGKKIAAFVTETSPDDK